MAGVPQEGVLERRGIAILVAISLVREGFPLWHPVECIGLNVARAAVNCA